MKGKMMEYVNYAMIAFGCLGLIALIFATNIVSERESSGVATAKSAALVAEINAQGAKNLSDANLTTINQLNDKSKAFVLQIEELDKKYSKLYEEVGPLIHMREKFQTLTDKYNMLNERISQKRPVIRFEEKKPDLQKGKGMGALLTPKGKKSKEATQ